MIRSNRRVHAWVAWALGTALVVGAWIVALATPGVDEIQSAIPVTVSMGEQGVGRNIAATVTDVRRASELTADGWSAEGNWVVIDLEASSTVTEDLAYLSHAELVVDGVRYRASERPASLLSQPLSAGIRSSGGLAFELPADIDSGDATLQLALRADTRLDSMIVLSFALGDVPVADAAELPETGWVNP